MDAEVEARTVRGPRWFVVSGKSGQDAATVLRTLIERRERVFDEFGELFEAHQIDASSIAPRPGPAFASSARPASRRTDGASGSRGHASCKAGAHGGLRMYHQIEAQTWMGIRRFLIAADTAREAAQEMTALLERGARLMDESGEWFQRLRDRSREPRSPRRSAAAHGALAAHYTNDGQRMV